MLTAKRKFKILDFDLENKPLTYWIPDRPTAEITAIASCWADDVNSMHVDLLGKVDSATMLTNFVERYDEADLVTGHYIRRHDLPIINGALMEFGFSILKPKMTCDTKLDMVKKADIPATQEFLADMLGSPFEKMYMSQTKWRAANRLTSEGLKLTEKRVTVDVYQHMMLRTKMVQLGLLKSPRVWRP